MARHLSGAKSKGSGFQIPKIALSPWLRVTGEHEEQRTMCPSLRLNVAWAADHQSRRWIGTGWLVSKIADAPTVTELRSMSGVVKKKKKTNFGVQQLEVRACSPAQVAECPKRHGEGCSP